MSGTQIEGGAALVTGGHRGFGRAMVQELLDRGAAMVYATSRSPGRRPTGASSRSCSTSPTTTRWPRRPGPPPMSRSWSAVPACS